VATGRASGLPRRAYEGLQQPDCGLSLAQVRLRLAAQPQECAQLLRHLTGRQGERAAWPVRGEVEPGGWLL